MTHLPHRLPFARRHDGSVLIIVLWVAFGLVSIALYFAQSMIFELRASDNRVAELEADQAIEGAARYVTYVLSNLQEPGMFPDPQTYEREAVPVGAATFWFIGRDDEETLADQPFFSLVDEASKLNLNTISAESLQNLPRMTAEFAAAIQDWRDTDSDVTASGAEADSYSRLRPPYKCKNAPFETVDELRLVFGAQMDILYGEDNNLNGVLDPNENDGNLTFPEDNRDGRLDSGILNYVTVYSRESNIGPDGNTRSNVNPAGIYGSLLDFYMRSGMKPEEFAQIADYITTTNAAAQRGLVNVNTASAEVLACIPGITSDKAQALVGYRRSNPDKLKNIAWVADVLEPAEARQAGPYLTVHSYQFSADIAAVGHHGRGYRRVRFVFDTSSGSPRVLFRQDLSHLGWALGKQARERILLAKNLP